MALSPCRNCDQEAHFRCTQPRHVEGVGLGRVSTCCCSVAGVIGGVVQCSGRNSDWPADVWCLLWEGHIHNLSPSGPHLPSRSGITNKAKPKAGGDSQSLIPPAGVESGI